MARRDKLEETGIAVRRIDALLDQARIERLAGRRDLPDRYARLALAVARKYQTGLPRHRKREVCRGCGAHLGGTASRTRISSGRIATTCTSCGRIDRRPIHPPGPVQPPRPVDPAHATHSTRPE